MNNERVEKTKWEEAAELLEDRRRLMRETLAAEHLAAMSNLAGDAANENALRLMLEKKWTLLRRSWAKIVEKTQKTVRAALDNLGLLLRNMDRVEVYKLEGKSLTVKYIPYKTMLKDQYMPLQKHMDASVAAMHKYAAAVTKGEKAAAPKLEWKFPPLPKHVVKTFEGKEINSYLVDMSKEEGVLQRLFYRILSQGNTLKKIHASVRDSGTPESLRTAVNAVKLADFYLRWLEQAILRLRGQTENLRRFMHQRKILGMPVTKKPGK